MKKFFIILSIITVTFISSKAQTYEEMVVKAMEFAKQKDYIGAELAMKAALKAEPANPGNGMLLFNLGTFQRNQGKLDEALISYNAAVAKFPKPVMLLHSRAALYCEMDKLDNALIDYSTIIAEDPKDTEAYYRRGLIYLAKNNLLDAENNFDKILEIDPDNLQAKSALCMILKRQEKWEEAEVIYSYLLSKNKTNAELFLNRAECYLQLGKLARAQEDMEKAVTYGYADSPLYVLRGQLRLAQYDKLSAKTDFLKAKELGTASDIITPLLELCK